MSDIFGALTMEDNERAMIGDLGERVVFDAIQQVMADWNADVRLALSAFVEKETENYTERYLLPGSGKLQEIGRQAPSAAVKRNGYWDVAFPLRGYGAALGGSRVDMAYLTVQELDAHLDTIMAQDLNTLRWRILTALFEDDNLTWTDPNHGSLTIRRLANGDGTSYPPVVGSEDDAAETHYDVSGYAEGSISDANQPIITIRDELVEHFGGRGTFGDNIVVFHNSSATDDLDDLTGYTEVAEQFIQYGVDSDLAVNIPNVPGRIHARLTGAWLSEWDWIPTGFMLGIHLEAPRPLVMRVDPADTGLPRGLNLVAEDEDYPMRTAYYERRFGLGVGNRLNGYAYEISTDGSYAPPTDYAE
jgi:hypothetical protein